MSRIRGEGNLFAPVGEVLLTGRVKVCFQSIWMSNSFGRSLSIWKTFKLLLSHWWCVVGHLLKW